MSDNKPDSLPDTQGDAPVAALTAGLAVLWHAALVLSCERYSGIDAFYHVAQAHKLWTDGPFAGVSSLPFTVLGEGGTDHHFLFHVLGLPLSFVPGLLGVKLSAVFFAAVATCGVVGWMWRARVRQVWLWTLLLIAATEVYNFRMSLLRTQTVDVPLLLFAVSCVAARRHVAAGALAFVFSWTHHGATILGPVAALCVLALAWKRRGLELRAPAWLVGGFVLGQIANPWFPNNLEYLFFHALFKTSNPLDLPVGGEWLPARWDYVLGELWPLHLALVAAASRLDRQRLRERLGADTACLALVWLLFLGLTFKHGRFVGFLVPIQAALVALVARDGPPLQVRAQALAAALALALCVPRFVAVRALVDTGMKQGDYASTAAFLREHAAPGELVFNVEWDQYPPLLFFAPHCRFAIGLDPNYLAYRSPKHFEVWNNLHAGQRRVANLGRRIRDLYGARYIVAPARDAPLLAPYRELELVHRAPEAMIWQIKPDG